MEKKSTKNIRAAFLLNLVFSIIELAGGLFTNSIAIIADSLHDFCDSLSIAVSWFLERKSEKKPDKNYTYGYVRFSVLGALISSMFLLVSGIVVIVGAIPRIINPQEVNYDGVLLLAVAGLFVNGLAVYKTAKGESINERAINLHLLEDVFGWLAVLMAAIMMKLFDVPVLDPILSVLITVFILFHVAANLKAVFEVFLERAPKDVDMQELREHLLKNESIKDIHHIHLWTLDGMNNYITLHVVINGQVQKKIELCRSDLENTDQKQCELQDVIIDIKNYVKEELQEHEIHHSCIEIEFESEECTDHECSAENNAGAHFGHHH